MKRKTFLKSLLGLVVAPTVIAEVVPNKKEGIFQDVNSAKTASGYQQIYKETIDITPKDSEHEKHINAHRKLVKKKKNTCASSFNGFDYLDARTNEIYTIGVE